VGAPDERVARIISTGISISTIRRLSARAKTLIAALTDSAVIAIIA